MMSFFDIISGVLFLVYIQLGIIFFYRNPASPEHRWLVAVMLFLGFIILGQFFFQSLLLLDPDYDQGFLSRSAWSVLPGLSVGYGLYSSRVLFIRRFRARLSLAVTAPGLYFFYRYWVDFWGDSGQYQFVGSESIFSWHLAYVFILAIILLGLGIQRSLLVEKIQYRFTSLLFFLMGFFFSLASVIHDFGLYFIAPESIGIMAPFTGTAWIPLIVFINVKIKFQVMSPEKAAMYYWEERKMLFLFCDCSYRLVHANTYTLQLLGIAKGDQQRKTVDQILPCLTPEVLARAWKLTGSGKQQCTLINPVTGEMTLKADVFPARDRFGDLQGLFIIGSDITPLAELQKAVVEKETERARLKQTISKISSQLAVNSFSITQLHDKLMTAQEESRMLDKKYQLNRSEKDAVYAEVHERVKDNMKLMAALIKLYSHELSGSPTAEKLLQTSSRVESLLLVHEHLYLSLSFSDVDFKGFLTQLIESIKQNYGTEAVKETIQIQPNIDDTFLNLEQAIPLGLIANELITNVFKHAFDNFSEIETPLLKVVFRHQNKRVWFLVSDNGIGRYESCCVETSNGQGLALAELLAREQLNASLQIRCHKGTSASLHFSF